MTLEHARLFLLQVRKRNMTRDPWAAQTKNCMTSQWSESERSVTDYINKEYSSDLKRWATLISCWERWEREKSYVKIKCFSKWSCHQNNAVLLQSQTSEKGRCPWGQTPWWQEAYVTLQPSQSKLSFLFFFHILYLSLSLSAWNMVLEPAGPLKVVVLYCLHGNVKVAILWGSKPFILRMKIILW